MAIGDFLNRDILQERREDVAGLTFSFEKFEVKCQAEGDFIDYSLLAIENNTIFNLSECSKDYQWYFCFKILTQIRSYGNGNGVIFLLDEPASNLHTFPQAQVLKNLCDLAARERVIYATHSSHLIDTSHELQNIYIVSNDKRREVEYPSIRIHAFEEGNATQYIKSVDPIIERLLLEKIKEDPDWHSRMKEGAFWVQSGTQIAEKMRMFLGP